MPEEKWWLGSLVNGLYPPEEEVRGIIVGGEDNKHLYDFYFYNYDIAVNQYIDGDWFASDAEAEAWFMEKYPDWYARGVEMRCYDRPRVA
jgi:hypothetical protein